MTLGVSGTRGDATTVEVAGAVSRAISGQSYSELYSGTEEEGIANGALVAVGALSVNVYRKASISTQPSLLSPLSGSQLSGSSVTLIWSHGANENARQYDVHLSTQPQPSDDSSLGNDVADSEGIGNTDRVTFNFIGTQGRLLYGRIRYSDDGWVNQGTTTVADGEYVDFILIEADIAQTGNIHELVGYDIVAKYLSYSPPVINHTPDETFTSISALKAKLDSKVNHSVGGRSAVYWLAAGSSHTISSQIEPRVTNCIISTDPDNPATINGGGSRTGTSGSNFGFLLDNCTNTEVSNFNITGMRYHGVAVGREDNELGGLNNRVLNCVITNCGTSGVAVRNQANDTLLEGLRISAIGSGDTRGEGIYLGLGNDKDDGNLSNHVFNTTIRGCDIFDTNAEAIDIKRHSRSVLIEFCHLHDISVKSQGAITVLLSMGNGYTTNYDANVRIRSCFIDGVTTREFNGDGIVAALGSTIIEDCIINNVAGNGISFYSDFDGPNKDGIARNNIIWDFGGVAIEENQTNGNGSSTANGTITRSKNYVESGSVASETTTPQFLGPFPATSVNAFSPSGDGVVVEPGTGDTLTATLGSQDLTETTAKIRWTPSVPATGQIFFGTSADNLNRSSVLESSYLSTHSQTIPNNPPTPLLDAATTYFFEVRGQDANGETYTQPGTFTTPGSATDAIAVNSNRGTTGSTSLSHNLADNDTPSATGVTTYVLEGTATNVVVDSLNATTGAYTGTVQADGSWSFRYNMLLDGVIVSTAFESGVYSSTPIVALYVDENTGSDSNSGTQSNPYRTISKGIAEATTGDTVYVRAGNYGDQPFNLNKNIIIEGWKDSPGDRPTLALFNDADFTIDSALIPVIDKGFRNNNNTGITVSAPGATVISFAVRQYKECFYMTGDNTHAKNIYAADSSRLDTGDYSGKGIHTRPGADGCTLDNVRARNVSAEALGVYGSNGTWSNFSAYCNTQANGIRDVTQYYLIVVGNNNNMSNLVLRREYGITRHGGHLAFKSNPQGNTLDGFHNINIDNAVQLRHQEARFNTIRNGVIDGGLGICCRDGGRDNIIEDIVFNNVRYPIWFHDGTEDEPNNTGFSGANNTFRRLVINNASNAVILTNGLAAGVRDISGNTFDDITVNGAAAFVEIDGGDLLPNNIFTNVTLNNVSTKISSGSSRPGGYQLDSGSTAGITVNPSNFSLP